MSSNAPERRNKPDYEDLRAWYGIVFIATVSAALWLALLIALLD